MPEKASDHRLNRKHRHCRRGNFPDKITVIEKGGSTPIPTVTLKTNASVVMQIGIQSAVYFHAGYDQNRRNSATNVNSADFCKVFLETSHRQAQCSFIPNYLRRRLATHCENNCKDFPPRSQSRLGYQPAGAPNQRPQQVAAQQAYVQSMQPHPSPSASEQ